MTDTVTDIFADEDLEGLTILGDEDDLDYDEDDIEVLEAKGNPRDIKPLDWRSEVYLFDPRDPGHAVAAWTDTNKLVLPSTKPRKSETVAQAALRGLRSSIELEFDTLSLVTRHISRIDHPGEDPYMRSTWVLGCTLEEEVDLVNLNDLLDDIRLGDHYYGVALAIENA